MSDWSIIVPETTQNLLSNPSLETNATGVTWAANAQGGGYGRSSTEAKFGAYSAKAVCSGSNNRYIYSAFTRTNGQNVTVSAWVRADDASSACLLKIQILDSGFASLAVNTEASISTTWTRIEVSATDATLDGGAGGGLSLYIAVNNQGDNGSARTWYADGLQAEALSYSTTYCDGDQPGCGWDGALHGSTSTRSASSRAGGRVRDLEDIYSFEMGQMHGTGAAPIDIQTDQYALLPGGEVQDYKVGLRMFTLSGIFTGTSTSNLHSLRQALYDVLKPDAVPGNQPVVLRYSGATVTKEIEAYYDSGLEAGIMARDRGVTETFNIRFLCADPFWYEVGESAQALDINDAPTLRYISGRLKSTGLWDDMGLTNNPGGGGAIYDILVASDNTVYICGSFTNWDQTGTGIDYAVKYTPSTDTYSRIDIANCFNGIVYAAAEGPDGIIYFGGAFTGASGDADADYFAQYDPSTDTVSAVGIPDAAGGDVVSVRDIAIDSSGNIYVVGDFDNFANVAAADGFAYWNGSSWATLGTPGVSSDAGAYLLAIDIDSQDNIYVGGNALNIGGDASADYFGYWNGSAWGEVVGVFNGQVADILVWPDDTVYVVGDFTTIAGSSYAYVAHYNGIAWETMGDGTTISPGPPAKLARGHDNLLYVAGAAGVYGGLSNTTSLAIWNGSTWALPDIQPSGAESGYAVAVGRQDPVVSRNYDLFFSFSTTGASEAAGSTTVTNDGTGSAYPRIKITQDTSVPTNDVLYSIRNETTGARMFCDYTFQPGETLTIDLRPDTRSIVSDYYGSRLDAVLSGSDLSEFALLPGDNTITAFSFTSGDVDTTAVIIWRDAYWSQD